MTPLDPDDIPDDTTSTGLFGWIGESVARGLLIRCAALSALLGALLGGLSEDAPSWSRGAAVVVGLGGACVLLLSQLFAWRRSRQWVLIAGVLVVTCSLFAFHLSQR